MAGPSGPSDYSEKFGVRQFEKEALENAKESRPPAEKVGEECACGRGEMVKHAAGLVMCDDCWDEYEEANEREYQTRRREGGGKRP